MWVPLIENNEHDGPGADYFVKKHVQTLLGQSSQIDTILLACTHYPLLSDAIRRHLPANTRLVSQGEIVAASLADYLHRHPEIEAICTKGGQYRFFTTDSAEDFNNHATTFFGTPVQSEQVTL